MNPSNNPSDNRTLTEADDRAIDAMLGELIGNSRPPTDFADSILAQLRSLRNEDAAVRPASPTRYLDETAPAIQPLRTIAASRKRSRRLLFVTGILATAATTAIIVSRMPRIEIQWKSIAKNEPAAESLDGPKLADSPARPSVSPMLASESTAQAAAQGASDARGVPLRRRDESAGIAETTPALAATRTAVGQDSPVDLDATVANVNVAIVEYWKRVGVTPTPSIPQADVVARISERFGVTPTIQGDQVQFASTFSDSDACGQLADRLVTHLFAGTPLVAGARPRMVGELTQTILRGEGIDQLIADWIGNDDLLRRDQHQQLAESLATNLLDANASCARCHDSPVDSRLVQNDYWALASIFVRPNDPALFYEMPDGRQRVAEPKVPVKWFASSDAARFESTADTANSVERFADSLRSSRTLAGSVANQLWKIGFGQPLLTTSSDPLAPPNDDRLQAVHAELTNLVLASGFDVRVVAEAIMRSDPMKRGSSSLVASGRWKTASDIEIAADALAVRTFAAAEPSELKMSQGELLAMMASRLGNTPSILGDTESVLAQANVDDSREPETVTKASATLEDYAWSDWTADRELLRGSWLHWIKDTDQQRKHVLYSLNREPGDSSLDWFDRLIESSDDSSIAKDRATDRLYWVLHESRR